MSALLDSVRDSVLILRVLSPAQILPLLSEAPLFLRLLAALIGFLILFAVFLLFRFIRRLAVESAFCRRYGFVHLPEGVRVYDRPRAARSLPDSFELCFPHWQHAAHDGSRDRRYSVNPLLRADSDLLIGPFLVVSRDPATLLHVVNHLRRCGRRVALHPLEEEKRASLEEAYARRNALTSSDALIRRFESRPTDFEHFCAALFTAMGFDAQVTPPAADGGFDLLLHRRGRRCIVECKCFSAAHSVGRPLLQKLVGVNAVQRAEEMAFVTTSSFSAPAKEYAAQFRIRLIDGEELMRLCTAYMSPAAQPAAPAPEECLLTRDDLQAHYPPDISP